VVRRPHNSREQRLDRLAGSRVAHRRARRESEQVRPWPRRAGWLRGRHLGDQGDDARPVNGDRAEQHVDIRPGELGRPT
jgi:hypothetical protein